MPTDSVWHEMMVERAKELARDMRLTSEQIALRCGISSGAASKIRQRELADG